jgi:hypothetical protein
MLAMSSYATYRALGGGRKSGVLPMLDRLFRFQRASTISRTTLETLATRMVTLFRDKWHARNLPDSPGAA